MNTRNKKRIKQKEKQFCFPLRKKKILDRYLEKKKNLRVKGISIKEKQQE